MSRKNSILFFITLIYITTFSENTFAKHPEVRYFVSNSGVRLVFTCITKINDDTVYFMANNNEHFFLVDSIYEYHHFKPGKIGRGVFLGMSSGLVLGLVFGAAGTSNDGNDAFSSSAWGAAIGGVIGGVIGGFSGASKKVDVFYDYRNYSRNKKLESLNKIFKCK
jgi:hypothetical protein